MLAPRCLGVLPIVILATTGIVHAQDPQEGPPPQEPSQAADTGLPSQVAWTFSFDAGWGVFGFGGSLYTDPKEGVGQDLGNRWMEGFVKPALSATYTFKSSSELYGRLSVVGERTYAKPPRSNRGTTRSNRSISPRTIFRSTRQAAVCGA